VNSPCHIHVPRSGARDLAGTVLPVSEAVILQAARKYGIGRKLGRAIIFAPELKAEAAQVIQRLRTRVAELEARVKGTRRGTP
jgi:hypothetical protein